MKKRSNRLQSALLVLFGLGLAAGIGYFQPLVGVLIAGVVVFSVVRELGWLGSIAPPEDASPDVGRAPTGAARDAQKAAQQAAREPLIAGTGFGGVLLESGEATSVLCLFPVASRSAFDELDKLDAAELARMKREDGTGVDALVVFNGGDEGYLGGDRVADLFGVPPDRVYAIDPERSLSRADGDDHGELRGAALDELRLDRVTLRRPADEDDATIVTALWDRQRARRRALLGLGIPLARLAGPKRVQYVIGTLAIDAAPSDQDVENLRALRSVMLVEGETGGACARHARVLSRIGIECALLGAKPEGGVESVVAAARAGGAALERAAELPVEVLTAGVRMLLVLGEDDALGRALDVFIARHDHAELWFERGKHALLLDDPERAVEHLERALERDPRSGLVQNSLAAVLSQLERHGQAVAAAKAALAALPGDGITLRTAVAVYARAGDRAAAQRLVDGATALSALERARMLALVESGADSAVVHSFPEHAVAARMAGTAALDEGRLDDAERLLRRAVELDRFSLESLTELGVTLGKLGRDDEVLALLGRALEEVPGAELLRFNRGNALLRMGRSAEAITDYERALDLPPPYAQRVRINLVAALCSLGRKSEAGAHVDKLEADGIDPSTLEQLRSQVR